MCALCGLGLPAKPLDGTDVSAALIEGKQTAEHKPILYFCPMGDRGFDLHCIRRKEWKLRVAQGIGGEIYLNDRTTQSRNSAWLATPELYNVALDPAESYDVAQMHPDLVADLTRELEALMATFPQPVIDAYATLKKKIGNPSTPPGASPRPSNQAESGRSPAPGEHRAPVAIGGLGMVPGADGA